MSRLLLLAARAAVVSLFLPLAAGQSSAASPARPPFDLASPRTSAVTQIADDGTIWARGVAWKAHFEPGSVEFRALPARGSAPARARFRLESATVGSTVLALDDLSSPRLDGERVLYERGALTEVYDLLAGGIEQSFVFASLPTSGDLVIRIAVEGALCGRDTEAGLVFESDGRTSVGYGDALITDAAGRRLARASELDGPTIVLRVPQAFLTSATFPLVVDPFITGITIDTGADVCFHPDVAFDATTQRWLVVYEQGAGSESDLLSRRFDANGVVIEEVAVDITDDDTVDPAVANNNTSNQFLIVWTKLPGFLGLTQKIRGRTRAAASTSQGAAFNVTTTSANETFPDVGGSPIIGDNKYLVVWETKFGLDPSDLRARTVTTSAGLGPILDVDTEDGFQSDPAVTKSCGPAGIWGIAYEEDDANNFTIRLAFVDRLGTLLGASLDADLDGAFHDGLQPAIAGDGRVFGVVWNGNPAGGNVDVIGSFFAFQGGVIAPLAGTFSLSASEPGAAATRNQFTGAIETDGFRFTYAYFEERLNSTDLDPFAATLDPLTGSFAEGHVSLGASIFADGALSIGSSFGSGAALPSRVFAVWQRKPSASDFDVVGALYAQP